MQNEYYVGKQEDGEWTVVRELGKGLISISQRDPFDKKIQVIYLNAEDLEQIVKKSLVEAPNN